MADSPSMHVAVIESRQNGKTYTSVLLRRSYRDNNNRVQKRTLANLSRLPPHTIPLLSGALKGKQYAEVGDILGDPIRSRHHGAVQATRTAMNAIGLPRLVARQRCPAIGAGAGQGSHPRPAGRKRRPQLSDPSRQPVNHRPLNSRGSNHGRREGGNHDRSDDPARRQPGEGAETAEGYRSHVKADPAGPAVCRQSVAVPIHVSC